MYDQNEKIVTSWEKNNKGIYVAFYFWMQNQMQYYERSYKKIINVLADIGGFGNTILFIATFINKLINKYIKILDTQDLIIDIDKKLADKYYKKHSRNSKFSPLKKSQSFFVVDFKKSEEIEDNKSPKFISKNIENNLEKNILTNNKQS